MSRIPIHGSGGCNVMKQFVPAVEAPSNPVAAAPPRNSRRRRPADGASLLSPWPAPACCSSDRAAQRAGGWSRPERGPLENKEKTRSNSRKAPSQPRRPSMDQWVGRDSFASGSTGIFAALQRNCKGSAGELHRK
jgi:hypothetical protein